MKRDEQKGVLDRQLTQLAGQLREQGQAPGRDLWPGIESRIEAVEQADARTRTSGGHGRSAAQGTSWGANLWRVGSLAAVLALMVGFGYVGLNSDALDPGVAMGTDAADGGVAQMSVLRRLDNTLQELNAALEADPDNSRLGKLVILVHRSRTEVLRERSEGWSGGNL